MKKILLGLLAAVLILIITVIARTLSFKPIEYQALPESVGTDVHPTVLSQALTFQTISHKKEMIDNSAFAGFHQYLAQQFPIMHKELHREVINDYSLMFTWRGSDPTLQPLVLLAHQDVVPVEYATLDQWDNPPFSGAVTQEYIYGRGALDDKGSLVSICAAVEFLLEQEFQPKRTIYFCFGHDEEIGGENGALSMAEALETRGVEAWMVLDEGGIFAKGIVPGIEQTVALVGTSEKGYVSLELSADLPGGHSSMPEQKTALGTINLALARLQEKPLPNKITPPIRGFIDHIGPHLPFSQKMAFANTWLFRPLIFEVYEKTASGAALIHTTQVPTIFTSGLKDNIVPTRAKAVVNYRLLPGDEPEEIWKRAIEIIDDSAVRVVIHDEFAVPASPVSSYNSEQFRQLAGAIKAVDKNALVTPYLVLGATDARHFTKLSKHIFRFTPIPITRQDLPRIHGLNERVSIEGFRKSVDFYVTLLTSN